MVRGCSFCHCHDLPAMVVMIEGVWGVVYHCLRWDHPQMGSRLVESQYISIID